MCCFDRAAFVQVVIPEVHPGGRPASLERISSDKNSFDLSKIEKILNELKLLFQKRGYKINWKDLEGQNVYQTLSALAMASPFSILEKQVLLETKNLNERKNKFEEILNTYSNEFSNLKTIQ